MDLLHCVFVSRLALLHMTSVKRWNG
jgi:hypothetical protein